MNDKLKILIGLAVFVVLVTFPIWYTIAAGDRTPPDLQLPDDGSHCVESREWMAANHMKLLNEWRNRVVRDGEKTWKSSSGEEYVMSLTHTCMGCHTSRENFCGKCHQYADVMPLRASMGTDAAAAAPKGIRCWDCHVDEKGD